MRRRLAMALIAAGLLTGALGTGVASADPTYPVMNADGGIFWRSAPDWNTPVRVSGFGVYNGTTIAVHCYQSGSAVPGSANMMWEQATVVAGPGYGSGWVNEHYINDGQAIHQPSPGVPPCNAPPPLPSPAPSLPSGGSLYYSPYNGSNINYHGGQKAVPSPATLTMNNSVWHHGADCTAGYAVPNPGGAAGGKLITTLAGWSNGRNGPIMLLSAKPTWWKQINYILLIDPGNKSAYYNGICDNQYPDKSGLLADWLAQSAGNRLVVLAG